MTPEYSDANLNSPRTFVISNIKSWMLKRQITRNVSCIDFNHKFNLVSFHLTPTGFNDTFAKLHNYYWISWTYTITIVSSKAPLTHCLQIIFENNEMQTLLVCNLNKYCHTPENFSKHLWNLDIVFLLHLTSDS